MNYYIIDVEKTNILGKKDELPFCCFGGFGEKEKRKRVEWEIFKEENSKAKPKNVHEWRRIYV